MFLFQQLLAQALRFPPLARVEQTGHERPDGQSDYRETRRHHDGRVRLPRQHDLQHRQRWL